MTRSLLWLLVRARGGAGPSDPRLLAFARGLALGALVGAAIAGSTLWNRRPRRD
ncbi:MAG: hypothetical protein ABSD62_00285 [Candidatus Limnocylindrales bacterium]